MQMYFLINSTYLVIVAMNISLQLCAPPSSHAIRLHESIKNIHFYVIK